jgi:hypothetical protein
MTPAGDGGVRGSVSGALACGTDGHGQGTIAGRSRSGAAVVVDAALLVPVVAFVDGIGALTGVLGAPAVVAVVDGVGAPAVVDGVGAPTGLPGAVNEGPGLLAHASVAAAPSASIARRATGRASLRADDSLRINSMVTFTANGAGVGVHGPAIGFSARHDYLGRFGRGSWAGRLSQIMPLSYPICNMS